LIDAWPFKIDLYRLCDGLTAYFILDNVIPLAHNLCVSNTWIDFDLKTMEREMMMLISPVQQEKR